jgi:uncharacterized protein (DUF1501 family)
MPSPQSKCDITRRDLLRWGVLGGTSLSLADYLRLAEASSAKPRAENVIFIMLQGGPSHLDTLDMKPEAPVEERGELKPIASAMPSVPVCELLPNLGKVLDRFTLIRGISHSTGDHPKACEYIYTGNRPTPALVHPAMGCIAGLERPTPIDLPAFVAVPNTDMNPGYLGVAHAAFKTTAVPKAGKPFEVRGLALPQGMSIAQVKQREALLADLDQAFRAVDANSPVLAGLDRFAQQAQEMILSPRARKAFDISQESPNILKLFADDEASQSMLLATRLIEHGVRFVTVTLGAWDSHTDIFKNMRSNLCPKFDNGIASLMQALELKGLLDRTLVVATGEFGRTPTINKNAGRDHWPRASWTLLAGGGVRRANLVGATDKKGHGPTDDTQIKPDDLAATIYNALGIDHRKEYYTRTGRPVILVPEGNVIEGVFA